MMVFASTCPRCDGPCLKWLVVDSDGGNGAAGIKQRHIYDCACRPVKHELYPLT